MISEELEVIWSESVTVWQLVQLSCTHIKEGRKLATLALKRFFIDPSSVFDKNILIFASKM